MKKLTAILGILLSVNSFAEGMITKPFISLAKEAGTASVNGESICTTKHNGWIDFEEGENCDLYIPSIDQNNGYTFVFKCENKETETVLKMNFEMGTMMMKENLSGHYDKLSIRCSSSKEHNFLVKSGEVQNVYSPGVTNRMYIEINRSFWAK